MTLPRKFTALVTPFSRRNNVDIEGLRENVEFQIKHGWAPLVLGTTGEAPTIREKEWEDMVEAVVEQTKGRQPVMVGTGTYCTEETVKRTRLARELGANIALVVTPYYNKPTQEGIKRHFAEVDKVEMRFVVYNIKGRTGTNIETATLEEISDYVSAVGVKEASGDLQQISDVCRRLQTGKFNVWSGDDGLTYRVMEEFGAYGVISVASNVDPERVGRVVNCVAADEYEEAAKLNADLQPLYKALFLESNPIPVKEAMRMMKEAGREGMNAHGYRLPLCEPSDETKATLRQTLEKANLL